MRGRACTAALAVLAITAAGVTVVGVGGPAGAARSARGLAGARLAADASGSITMRRDDGGRVTFVGTRSGAAIDNPAVRPDLSVAQAARAHLERYGAAFGLGGADTTLVTRESTHTLAGTDAVTYRQEISGVPVIGGEVVVGLRADRQLASVLATVSQVSAVPAAVVSEAAARSTARSVLRSGAGPVRVSSRGRWLLDAAALGGRADLGAHAGWRFEVRRGVGVRRDVLVDDQTGGVLMSLDLIEGVDRVVCDSANVSVAAESPCTSGFARTEGSGAGGVADVNTAFDLSGAVSQFYADVPGIDLTALIGLDVGGAKKLASTVRFCRNGSSCPYANAFWNGLQMYYGDGYASADDVVGHEMTHGVIDQYSQLFYWGQSGAINESIADIMGEIVDHRNPSAGDSATDWKLGEDVPGYPDGLRNLMDPTIFSDPDRTSSGFYTADPNFYDSGGVHTNSGVSNKTAYLIAKGGTFNGRTITGIDAGSDLLVKTGRLYFQVIQTLSSGSDFADLAVVLDQSCQDLVGTGSPAFTSADCAAVHQAGLATELAITPTNAAQPADAPLTCPVGLTKRVLFDSETGSPTSKFTAGPTWTRGDLPGWGSNAHSGTDAWASSSPTTATTSPLVMASGVALPAGQQSYLSFQHWRLFEYDSGGYYDGGAVEVDDLSDAAGPVDVAALPWVNGPSQTLASGFGNPAGGRHAFGGDSRGYIGSRLDLSSYAGSTIKPRFVTYSDSLYAYVGWFVDDVTVYTCDPSVAPGTPAITGTARQGQTLTAHPGTWSPAGTTFAYQWLRDGAAVPSATGATYRLGAADVGRRTSVRVTGSAPGFTSASATSTATAPVVGLITAGRLTVTGKARVGSTLSATLTGWRPAGLTVRYAWLRDGTPVARATKKTYRLASADKGTRLQVRVVVTKAGYLTLTKTSGRTGRVG